MRLQLYVLTYSGRERWHMESSQLIVTYHRLKGGDLTVGYPLLSKQAAFFSWLDSMCQRSRPL